jgi:hypothetical protein
MRLVFVCGVNRSGTHLLLSLLSGHSQLFVTGYEDGWISALARAGSELEQIIKQGRLSNFYRFLYYYTGHPRLRLLAWRGRANIGTGTRIDEVSPFDSTRFEEAFLSRLSEDTGWTLKVNKCSQVVEIFYHTLAEHFGEAEKPYFVSKPAGGANVFQKAENHLREMQPMLLCIVRDPRAVISSHLHRDPRAPIRSRALDWVEHLDAVDSLSRFHPVHVVRYEDLCEKPEATIRGVADFLTIPFEEALLRPQLMGQDYLGNSAFDEIGPSISSSGVNRWKEALSPEQIRDIEREVGATNMKRAGYEPVYSQTTAPIIGRSRSALLKMATFVNSRALGTRRRAAAAAFLFGLAAGALLVGVILVLAFQP